MKNFKPTIFKICDTRNGDTQARIVTRELYKKAARLHNKAGQPMRTRTTYSNGRAVKELTLMSL